MKFNFIFLTLLFMVFSICYAKENSVNDMDNERNEISMHAQRLFMYQKYDELDKYTESFLNPLKKFPNGGCKLCSVEGGINRYVKASGYSDNVLNLILKWKESNNKSPMAAIAEANYWEHYAWVARGGGFYNSLTEEQKKGFVERVNKAELVLLKSQGYAKSNPLWYDVYMRIASDLGWSIEDKKKLFREAVKSNKLYFPHYFTMLESLLPKWGGSYKIIDDFVKDSVELTKDTEGHSLYVRIYGYLDEIQGEWHDIFKESFISIDKMKEGYKDLIERYPNPVSLNVYASFSCRVNDKEVYKILRKKLGDDVSGKYWDRNTSIKECDKKLLN